MSAPEAVDDSASTLQNFNFFRPATYQDNGLKIRIALSLF